MVGLGVGLDDGEEVGADVMGEEVVGSGELVENASAQLEKSGATMGSSVGLGVLLAEKAASQLEKSGTAIGSSVGRRVGNAVVGLGVGCSVGSEVAGLSEGEGDGTIVGPLVGLVIVRHKVRENEHMICAYIFLQSDTIVSPHLL